jgi:hypothetical protein
MLNEMHVVISFDHFASNLTVFRVRQILPDERDDVFELPDEG